MTLATWIVMGFVFGIAAVWLYAAIRPRYGAGIGTPVRAGIAVWSFASLYLIVIIVNLGVFAFNWTARSGAGGRDYRGRSRGVALQGRRRLI